MPAPPQPPELAKDPALARYLRDLALAYDADVRRLEQAQILVAPNGTAYRVSVNNRGQLRTQVVSGARRGPSSED